ncbi:hypothetical protein IT072_05520 [Leifsonia sp. ZF2019]|uniref:hypothetical protein n=1 Tax=Leifsonia sp. ZF2019 TaxID=2781978 RepID=UPI001CC1AA48|nr:hypothetical protein [Leifsonia sp. ZF2019]UAJ80485.1 hypothetical protein IT072_05520 [Leifsonia sp. ZF2019]
MTSDPTSEDTSGRGPEQDPREELDERDELDETVIVGRADAEPVAAAEELDETVIVRRADAEPVAAAEELDETVIVRRAGAEPEAAAEELDETVIVRRAGAEPVAATDALDETIVVDRLPSDAVEPPLTPRLAVAATVSVEPPTDVEPSSLVESPLTAGSPPAPAEPALDPAPPREPVAPVSGAEPPASSDESSSGALETDLDDTVVPPRAAAPQELETVPIPGADTDTDSDVDDDTVGRATLDATRVVHRHDGPLDATRVVRRDDEAHDDPFDATRVVRRDEDEDESDDTIIARRPVGTVSGDIAGSPVPSAPVASPTARAQLAPTRRSLRAKRTPIVLPSGTAASERAAAALGADAVVRYEPRPIPEPPAPGPDLGSGPEATRAATPSMRSVSRATRSAGWITLGSIVGACVVSIVGLIVIVTTVVGG